jgi:MFS family permease
VTKRTLPASISDSAFRFVLTIGIVNLFADVTYEGGASINGPFLAFLGAGAAAISIVAGLGEFFGYALRSLSGYIADRTGRYWPLTVLGYSINLLSVPAMALAPSWQLASALILTERIGRAIRKPNVEAMLSYTTGKHGKAWVYAVNTALDETGATIGPLVMALALFQQRGFRTAYALLLVSCVLALSSLLVARVMFPVPSRLQDAGQSTAPASGFTKGYWFYVIAGSLFAAGLMSFEFISFHLLHSGSVSPQWIPIFLALATVMGIVASLVLGRLYDRNGIAVVVGSVCFSAFFSPLVFNGGFSVALAGMLLWGIGYAIQDTLLKGLIASVLPEGHRSFAFGLFYLGYGGGWLAGGVTTGLLYEHSRTAVILFSILAQLASVPFFVVGSRR